MKVIETSTLRMATITTIKEKTSPKPSIWTIPKAVSIGPSSRQIAHNR